MAAVFVNQYGRPYVFGFSCEHCALCYHLIFKRNNTFRSRKGIRYKGYKIGISKLDLYEKITTTAYHPVSDYCAVILFFFYLEAEIMAHAKS